jgi:hypothetical protein
VRERIHFLLRKNIIAMNERRNFIYKSPAIAIEHISFLIALFMHFLRRVHHGFAPLHSLSLSTINDLINNN